MSDFTEWRHVDLKVGDEEENPYGPVPGFVEAVLESIGPDVIAGSRNRLRAFGCVLLGGVGAFTQDRITKVPVRELRRFAVRTLGQAARLPGDDIQSLITFCLYAVETPARKTPEELAALIAKYPSLEDDIRRDADIVAAFLDHPDSAHPAWQKAYDAGSAEFMDWWENPDAFSSRRLIKAITAAPGDAAHD